MWCAFGKIEPIAWFELKPALTGVIGKIYVQRSGQYVDALISLVLMGGGSSRRQQVNSPYSEMFSADQYANKYLLFLTLEAPQVVRLPNDPHGIAMS